MTIHLVARSQVLPQRLRDDEGVLRGRRPQVQLVLADVEPGREAFLRRVHLAAGLGRGREGVVGLHFRAPVETIQPVDRLAAGIGTAGILEMRKSRERRLGESRELRAHEIQVEAAHGQMTSSRSIAPARQCCWQVLVVEIRDAGIRRLSVVLEIEKGIRRFGCPAAEPEHLTILVDVGPY